MADRVFYTLHRFFAAMHGPGDAAEVAALFTWCFLLLFNVATALVLILALLGDIPFVRKYLPYVFGIASVSVAITQYFRYLAGRRMDALYQSFESEPPRQRSQRRWISLGYSMMSLVAFIGSLWIWSATR